MRPGHAVVGLVLLGLGWPAPAADWPMWGRDSSRNMVSPETGAPLDFQLEDREDVKLYTPARGIAWSAKLGYASATPVVAGGLVWVGTTNSHPRDRAHTEDASVLMCF